jgi:hypothetical protein
MDMQGSPPGLLEDNVTVLPAATQDTQQDARP